MPVICGDDEQTFHAACSAPVHAAMPVCYAAPVVCFALASLRIYEGATGAQHRSVVTQQ